jgi:hypothetical protein
LLVVPFGEEEHVAPFAERPRHHVGDLKHRTLSRAVDEKRADRLGDESHDRPGGDLLFGDETARDDVVQEKDIRKGNVVAADQVADARVGPPALGGAAVRHFAANVRAQPEHARERAGEALDGAHPAPVADDREKGNHDQNENNENADERNARRTNEITHKAFLH